MSEYKEKIEKEKIIKSSLNKKKLKEYLIELSLKKIKEDKDDGNSN